MGFRTCCCLLVLAGACAVAGCGGDEGPTGPLTISAGAAKTDLTPAFEPYTDTDLSGSWDEGEPFEDLDGDGQLDSLWLGGFGPRQPTAVHDPLEARTVALEVGDQRFTLTAVDALGLSAGRVAAVQAAVLAEIDPALGLSAERLIIASTHTHAGPDTIGVFGPDTLVPGWDGAYLDLVVERTAESIVAALAQLEPAELVITSAEAGAGFVRDSEPPEITDPYVGIVQARRPDGSAIATLTTIANHVEAAWAGNTEVSSDYFHPLRAGLEQQLGGLAVAFVADLGLMQTPAEIGEPGFARAETLGGMYAGVILDALDGAEPRPASQLEARFGYAAIPVPLQNTVLFFGLTTGVIEGYEGFTYDDGSDLCPLACMNAPAAAVRLGDALTVVAVAGELTPELIVGGITQPPGYAGPYPDAPAEPHLLPHIRTAERFIVGLAYAELGYIYPKMTHDPDEHTSQRYGPGPDVAGHYLGGLGALLAAVNAE